MAKKPPVVEPVPEPVVVDEAPEVLEPAPAAIPVVAQPAEPVGLPTGNPWDLAYPLGYTPPALQRTGGDATVHGPGFVGAQADSTPNESYTVAGVAPLSEEN